MRLTMLWLFTIVRAAVHHPAAHQRGSTTTAPRRSTRGVLLVSSLCLTGMSWWGRRHRDLLADDRPQADGWSTTPIPIGVPAVLVISLLLTLIVPEHRRVPAVRAAGRRHVIDRARAQAPVAAAAAGLTAPSSSRHGSSPSISHRHGPAGRPGLPVDPEPLVDPALAPHGLHRDAVLGVAELAGDADRGRGCRPAPTRPPSRRRGRRRPGAARRPASRCRCRGRGAGGPARSRCAPRG